MSQLSINFQLYNSQNNIFPQILDFTTPSKMCVGILLAGGNSTRFKSDVPKQLYKINTKPIISYSIDAMENIDHIVIVTNNKCFDDISKIIAGNSKITLLVNNIDCRLESIKTALVYIDSKFNAKNIIIHDVARPYVKKTHIESMMEICNHVLYTQYCLKLTNGLIKIDNTSEEIKRDDYVELCTPICINFKLALFIYQNYIDKKNRITCEFIPILDLMEIKYELIYGNINFLKKITVYEDICE